MAKIGAEGFVNKKEKEMIKVGKGSILYKVYANHDPSCSVEFSCEEVVELEGKPNWRWRLAAWLFFKIIGQDRCVTGCTFDCEGVGARFVTDGDCDIIIGN